MKKERLEHTGPSPESSPEEFKVGAATLAHEKHLERNEDAVLADKENGVFAVFDGIGGHTAGEVAAGDAKEYIAEQLKKEAPENASLREVERAIKSALYGANKKIFEKAGADPEQYRGMGTTASVVKIWESGNERKAVIGNIGDSRVYKLTADGRLEQLTIDDNHCLDGLGRERMREIQEKLSNLTDLSELVDDDERKAWDFKNTLSQALGAQREIVPRMNTVNISKGEKLLIVSDGVHDNLTDRRIEEVLSEARIPEEVAQSLVDEARDVSRGGESPRAKQDDMSAIVIEF